MKFLKNIISGGARELSTSIGKVVDNLSTSDKEKHEAKNQLTDIVTTKIQNIAALQTDVLSHELKGSWLQRSWRPLVMLAFAGIVVYSNFIAPAFGLPNTELQDNFWHLLDIGLGGYVVGRSMEKITDRVTQNVDMSFLRKRDRKPKYERKY